MKFQWGSIHRRCWHVTSSPRQDDRLWYSVVVRVNFAVYDDDFLTASFSGSVSFFWFHPFKPSGRVVSSSSEPVPSTNCSYVDFSGNGRGPSNSIMSSLLRISCFNRRSATYVSAKEFIRTKDNTRNSFEKDNRSKKENQWTNKKNETILG